MHAALFSGFPFPPPRGRSDLSLDGLRLLLKKGTLLRTKSDGRGTKEREGQQLEKEKKKMGEGSQGGVSRPLRIGRGVLFRIVSPPPSSKHSNNFKVFHRRAAKGITTTRLTPLIRLASQAQVTGTVWWGRPQVWPLSSGARRAAGREGRDTENRPRRRPEKANRSLARGGASAPEGLRRAPKGTLTLQSEGHCPGLPSHAKARQALAVSSPPRLLGAIC